MTAEVAEADRLEGAPHPRESKALHGHAEAEQSILSAWESRRLPHALLIGGPEGIGKATLAYRIARFVLVHGPHQSTNAPVSLTIPDDHPVSRQVEALAHPDLLVLRRVWNEDTKKLRSEIRVEDVRRTISFFGSTSAYGGYRVCIVDYAEELNKSGANALLKILEEPPAQSLLIIVSQAPGRLLPTIRSRCRRLILRALSPADVMAALEDIAARIDDLPREKFSDASAASGGSVRHALQMLMGESIEVRNLTASMLAQLPAIDGEGLHVLGERIRGSEDLTIFADTVGDWVASAATRTDDPPARLARLAEAWEKVRRAAVEAEAYNLDRKPMVFQVFSDLAEATR